MILAETAIDGDAYLLIMAALVAVLAVWCFSAAVGFRYARQAGGGEDGAMRKWVLAGALQLLVVVYTPLVVVGLVVVGLQAYRYWRARDEAAFRT